MLCTTTVLVPLGCRAAFPAPCQTPQHPVHLIPSKIISKLKVFATHKVTCSVLSHEGFHPCLEKSRVYGGEMKMGGKKGKLGNSLGSSLPLMEID